MISHLNDTELGDVREKYCSCGLFNLFLALTFIHTISNY